MKLIPTCFFSLSILLSFGSKIDSAYVSEQIKKAHYYKSIFSDSTLIVGNKLKKELEANPEFSYALITLKGIEANYYYRIGDHQTALQLYDEIGKEAKVSNDSAKLSFAFYSKGNVYQFIDMYPESIPMFLKSIDFAPKGQPVKGIAQKQRNLGESYFFTGEYDSAITYLDKVIDYAIPNKDTGYLLVSLTFKAHSLLKKYDESMERSYLDQASQLADSAKRLMNGEGLYPNLNLVLAEIAFRDEAYTIALNELLPSWNAELQQDLSFKSLLPEISSLLYRSYYKLNRFDSAAYFIEQNQLYRDSIEFLDGKRMTQKLNLELNYKNQKMREEMQRKSELKQGKMRYESYLARQRVYLWVGSLTILGFLVVALIVLRRSRKLKSLYQRLDERTKDLRDSINYAKRIQDTILPSERLLNEAFREHFVYYKPKDVVAGDFYWIKLKEDCVYFAVADCTGHGVPGALVSLICHEALEKSVFTLHDKNLNEILDSVRDLVVKKLNAKGYQKVKDGMDIALCKIGPDKKKLEFVGAHNPLWVSRNKEIIQIKGDRQPVGLYDNSSPFKNHQFKIEKDDVIYLSSDGYVDQFGGDSGKKFKSSRLKKQLLGISNNKLKDQKLELANQFVKWKADFEQLDDVCIMGVKV